MNVSRRGRCHTNPRWDVLGIKIGLTLLAALVVSGPGCERSQPERIAEVSDVEESSDQPIAPEPHSSPGSGDDVPGGVSAADESADDRPTETDLADDEAVYRRRLVADPNDTPAVFSLATLRAERGDLTGAIELLDSIPVVDSPDDDGFTAGMAALGQAAQWCVESNRYDEAETKLRAVLDRAPTATPALRELAHLLNRQGRRHEAAKLLRILCILGDVRQDELHGLMVLGDAMYDRPGEAASTDHRAYEPIGPAAEARRMMNQKRYAEAAQTLRPTIESGDAKPAVRALYGRILVEAQDDPALIDYLARADDEVREMPDHWAALGAYLLAQARFDEATHALAQAVDRDPTDLISMGRLRQALLAVGDEDAADRVEQRWRLWRDAVKANNRVAESISPEPELIEALASKLDESSNQIPAVLWRVIAASDPRFPDQIRTKLAEFHQSLVRSKRGFAKIEDRLCGIHWKDFPAPDLNSITAARTGDAVAAADPRSDSPQAVAAFANVASAWNINHTFRVASRPQSSVFTIYQILGAAAVVLDYDLDGCPDLYFGQGGADPPAYVGLQSDRLLRHPGIGPKPGIDSQTKPWIDVTDASATTQHGYTTGATSGDWNQDGFPDLVVAGLGFEVLAINNGDGTFRTTILDKIAEGESVTRVPSSTAMADLSGDGLPDLFQVNYVDDPDIRRTPPLDEHGRAITVIGPNEYGSAKNRVWYGLPDGQAIPVGWPAADGDSQDHSDASTGLGVVVANLDDQAGSEVFVGNDVNANGWWRRDPISGQWIDQALARGCAFGSTGNSTASMGIAVADFDRSGTPDIHITNYQEDVVSLFIEQAGIYRDRNAQYGLDLPSRPVLGFGTQAIDFDNDGWMDLAVANGHLEDEAGSESPMEQPPQLFRNKGNGFELSPVQDPSGYWNQRHIGRAMARADFNRDGRSDLVITHIEAPAAVLINQTATDHHWIGLQLIGTSSERDAIGATIEVTAGDQTTTHWITAGDGYLARNDSLRLIGLADAPMVDRIRITWPRGSTTTIDGLAADANYLIVEGEDEADGDGDGEGDDVAFRLD